MYRDIHHFIDVIYYLRVDDVSDTYLDFSKDIEKLKTPLRVVWKCCSAAFEIGSTIFLLQLHFKYFLHNRLLLFWSDYLNCMVLTLNNFSFDGEHYQQIGGVTMGTKIGPN